MSRRTPDLGARLDALERALAAGRGRCDPAQLAAAESLVGHAAARRRIAPERTVVAFAGGTGSGKSTLFNVLAGEPLAPTGVRRPTTSQTRAAVWPPSGAGTDATADSGHDSARLLDWLNIRDRHYVTGGIGQTGLILVDLPDFDSTAAEHRSEADRLIQTVDLLVWVLDPQKYADAAVHERYLRPLHTHRDVMLVVLNQIDRLDDDAALSCQRHLSRLLADDGLPDVPVIATSATGGTGLSELHAALTGRVRSQDAAAQRLHADVDAAVAELAPLCSAPAAKRSAGRQDARSDEALAQSLAEAAGVRTVAAAAGASYRQRAAAQVGWPPTRWISRTRANPLRRLHLGPGASGPSALSATGGVQRAQVSNALRELAAQRTSGMAAQWRRSATAVLTAGEATLPDELDRAVRTADLSQGDRPRWWAAFRTLQLLLFTVALAGAAWLAVLAVLSYLRLPDPTVHIARTPLPTVLLLGGLVLGLLLALAVRPFVRIGARRRSARARRSLEAGVRSVARRCILDPLTAELRSVAEFREAVNDTRR